MNSLRPATIEIYNQIYRLETLMLLFGSLAFAFLFATADGRLGRDLVLYGAGSLHGVMADIAQQFDQRFGTTTKVTFGPPA